MTTFLFVYFESYRQQPTRLVGDFYAVEEVSFCFNEFFTIPDSRFYFLLFNSVIFQTRVFFAYFENSQKDRGFNEMIKCLRNLAQYDIYRLLHVKSLISFLFTRF